MSVLTQALLLVGEPGSLIYNLVLLALLGWAAIASTRQWRRTRDKTDARLAGVVSGLLLLRLLIFVVFLLGAASILDPLIFIPPLARAVSALTIVLIVLLLAFPEPHPAADLAAAGAILLTPLGVGIAWSYWIRDVAAGHRFYNGSPQETVWEIVHLGLLLAGLALVGARRKTDWPLGIGLLTVLLIGHIIHYLFPLAGTNVPGAVHLAEIVAYPILAVMIHLRLRAFGPALEGEAPEWGEAVPVGAGAAEGVNWIAQRVEQARARAEAAQPERPAGLGDIREAAAPPKPGIWSAASLAENLEADPGAPCPRLGLAADSETRHVFTSPDNRCYVLASPAEIAFAYQGAYCLTSAHVRCPVFTGRVLTPKLPIGEQAGRAVTPESRPRRFRVALIVLIVFVLLLGLAAVGVLKAGG